MPGMSERRRAANRKNAKKSTGPTSEAGRRASRLNALRHGLAIDVTHDPAQRDDVERMAVIYSQARGETNVSQISRAAAATEIDLLRIGKARASVLEAFYRIANPRLEDMAELNANLTKLARYERRAFSRSKKVVGLMRQNEPI